jgi:hypothetical protein
MILSSLVDINYALDIDPDGMVPGYKHPRIFGSARMQFLVL